MKAWHSITVAVVSAGILAGCGQDQAHGHVRPKPAVATKKTTTQNSSAAGTQVLRVGAAQYQGQKNLKKYEALAQAKPTNFQAQVNAGTAAGMNSQPNVAVQYWEKAIQIDPHIGNPYEYIGNIYLEDYNNPQEALVWYKKSIANGPSYPWGWYRMVQLEAEFGNMAAAKNYAAEAAKVLPADSKVLQSLETFVTPKS